MERETMDVYQTIVADAAKRLEAKLRATVGNVYVAAIPTTETENGRVLILGETENAPLGATIVRPSDNHASTYARWGLVPYSDLAHVLWHALRREPILPIH